MESTQALSATVSNAAALKGWFASVHGPTDVVETSFRPVPLRYEFAAEGVVQPLFRAADVGPGSETEARERSRPGQEKGAKFPTSKAHISVVFHSFWLIFGRVIISRNGLDRARLSLERARTERPS